MQLNHIEYKHQFDNDDNSNIVHCSFCDKPLLKDLDEYVTLKSGEVVCEACMWEIEEE